MPSESRPDEARLIPERPPPVTVAGRTLPGDDLLGAAGAVAAAVGGCRVVAVEASASLETIVAVVGCLLAGSAVVPVPPDSGPRERDHLLADSGAVWCPPVDLAARASPPEEPSAGTALIMYTSGTTGAPKGVVLSRRAIAAGIDGLRDAWAWGPDDVLAHGLPLFHVHGLILGVLGALRAGSPLVHTGRPTPDGYAAAAAESGATLLFGVPTVWGRVAADPAAARALRPARLLVSGSAALPAPVFDDLRTLAGQGPVERYGMTETLITLAARADGPRRAGRVGGPIAGVSARVLASPGEIGELEVRGATLFDGYLNRPAVTAETVTSDGWFRTGDSALVDDAGYQIVGRTKDDLIKTGGYRVGAGEIEACLLAHPGVAEAAVVGVPDPDLGQRIIAYVVGDATEQALIDHVAGELSVHKRPREVRFVPALPRNAMGKVRKADLSRPLRPPLTRPER